LHVACRAAATSERDIRDFLVSQGGRRLARDVWPDITAAFRLLASHPEAGHLRQDLTPLPVKFWPVFSYLIVYDSVAWPLAIVRVLDGRRDVEAILNRGTE
jgi:toxin ParE1/3/4